MIVLDASALLEMLLGTAIGNRAVDAVRRHNEPIHAPHLLDVEVLQVLRRFESSGQITAARARTATKDLGRMTIERHEHTVLAERVWQLRRDLTAYDAAYVSLAEALDAPLLTTDRRLARSSGHRARVERI